MSELSHICVTSIYFGGLLVTVFAWLSLLACLCKFDSKGFGQDAFSIFYIGIFCSIFWFIALPVISIYAYYKIEAKKRT